MLLLAALLALRLAPVSPDLPNRQPQFAAGNGVVALAFGSGDALWFTKSRDNGRTFAPPVKVGELPKLLLGRHRGPRLVISGTAMIVTAISSGTDLFSWRSTDGGRTWTKGPVINDKPTAAREGLQAMAADNEGHIAAAWLDDRVPGGKKLWGAFSQDAGATWSKNVMLYESPDRTICECCHPSLISLGHGEFAVMWRNAIGGSRDFYVLRLRDGKPVGTAVKQGEGTWKLEACPMDGGGIAMLNGKLVTAWRREKDVYFFEPGKPEIKLGAGQDPALAANAKGAYTIWTEGKAIVALQAGAAKPARLSENGAFPALTALPDGAMLAAWEENGAIATHRIE